MDIFDTNGYVNKQVFDALVKARDSASPHVSGDGVLDAIADMIRYNTVYSVARAGTGHLGASLSIIELLTCIYFDRFNFEAQNKDDNNRDIFVLSKGHAVPALYSTLAAKGYIEISALDTLRRMGGLQGHCDISTNGIEANTGSLAMGLSRAAGYALAKKRMGCEGKVIAIVGDGELQEGQIWEALLSAASFKLSNLYVIIDCNKVQTDQFTDDITEYGDIGQTFEKMGFDVLRARVARVCDAAAGFDALSASPGGAGKPKVFIADTIKGQGVSFMEHTSCLTGAADRYIWHNKAPDREQMERIFNEIFARAGGVLKNLGAEGIRFPDAGIPKKTDEKPAQGEPLTPAFSEALLRAGENDEIVVFDADLEADCGLTPFREKYPQRFIETGIMEQHLVSGAAAFARMGFFPVMNSYTAFLTSRANEQIYNYASEGGRGLVAGHMSGVIPATPGKSHQAYRDIACMKSIPGMLMYQPSTPDDCTGFLERVFGGEFKGIIYLRMSMVPPAVKLPDSPAGLAVGKSYALRSGTDVIITGIGPVVLGECLAAAEQLEKEGISVEVRGFPWLNNFDAEDLKSIVDRNVPVLVVEDHYKDGGFGEGFFAAVAKSGSGIKKSAHIAIEDFTTTGLRDEALRRFGLDRGSIAQKTKELLR